MVSRMISVCFCLFLAIGSVRLNPLLLPAPPAPVQSPILLPPLSFNPDANHALAISRQNSVLNAGQSVSLGIANTLIRPFTFFNNQLASVASTLPSFMAAQGAALGTAIATAIQLGALAANSLASGITGTLVSIPVSLVTGGTAHLVGAIESGRQLVQATGVKAAQAQQNINNNVLQAGQRIFRPIALIPSRLISGLSSRISVPLSASVPALPLPALKTIQSPLVAPVKTPLVAPLKPIELPSLSLLTPQVLQVVQSPEVQTPEMDSVQQPEPVQAPEPESVQTLEVAPTKSVQASEIAPTKSVQAPEPDSVQTLEVAPTKTVQASEIATTKTVQASEIAPTKSVQASEIAPTKSVQASEIAPTKTVQEPEPVEISGVSPVNSVQPEPVKASEEPAVGSPEVSNVLFPDQIIVPVKSNDLKSPAEFLRAQKSEY